MQPYPIIVPPGVFTDATRYARRGRWVDSNLIRFNNGKVQGFGGWTRALADSLRGICRTIASFATLTGTKNLAFGTSKKAYLLFNTTNLYDITPVVYTASPTDVLDTVIGSNRVGILLPPSVPKVAGTSIIISGVAAPVGGIPETEINAEHETVEIIGDVHYFDVATNASANVSGGGGLLTVEMLYPAGVEDGVITSGGGWGDPPWGFGGWGGTTDGTGALLPLRFWSGDTWGEDLLISPSDGPIFYWDATNPSDRALPISGMMGASQVPVAARQIIVFQRIVLAFATNPIGSSDQDPMLIRWSDDENYLEWDPTVSGSAAGEIRLLNGSVFVGAFEAPNEILVWSNTALHGLSPTPGNDIFLIRLISPRAHIFGPKAMVLAGDAIYWGGLLGFFRYAGAVQAMDCTVQDFIMDNIDRARMDKTVAGAISEHNEVIWMFVTKDSPDNEPNAYVKFNFVENTWDKGRMGRTAWIDADVLPYPVAARQNGAVLFHELGTDDREVPTNPLPLVRMIEHGPVEIDGKGYQFITTRNIMPDIDFMQSEGNTASLKAVTIIDRGPGTPAIENPPIVFSTNNALAPRPNYQLQAVMRRRARTIAMRYFSDEAGFNWRIGDMRIIGRPDGRK
jgi:hypothetical protein